MKHLAVSQYMWIHDAVSAPAKKMAFMGRGFTSRGRESGSVFSASMCIIQASKHYVESLPLVLKDKRSCFSQGERFAVQLPLECAPALRK